MRTAKSSTSTKRSRTRILGANGIPDDGYAANRHFDPNGSGTSSQSKFKNYGKIPVVGKTGSTQSYGDVWFQGYTPDITLGVWVGYEKPIIRLSKDGRAARESSGRTS